MKRVTEFLDRPVTMAHAFAGIVGVFVAVFFMSNADAAELEKGNFYDVAYLRGTVRLTCTGYDERGRYQTRFSSIPCYRTVASPGSYSRFIDEDSEAAKVKLFNITKDYSKTKKFYPKKNRSKNFNLLIRTLFQKPLLQKGINHMKYEMIMEDGTVADYGEFDITVETQKLRCPTRSMFSYNLMDCSGGGQAVCNEYFYQTECQ